MRFGRQITFFAALCVALPATAADPARTAAIAHWRALARGDVETAYRLLLNNHPAAVPALGDTRFQQSLRHNYRIALARAGQLTDYDGYAATMLAFANGMKDEHIWSRSRYGPSTVRWPGMIVSKKGSRWIITDTDPAEDALKNAELISCDGKSADQLGRERIGAFRADWSIAAQQVKRAPLLLVDDGNPFALRPDACLLRSKGGDQKITLNWRNIDRLQLQPRLAAASGYGHAGYGVEQFDGGTWIALEGLGSKAPAVLDAVRERLSDIRKSKLVVIDMRGNGGGNSEYGHRLAQMLLGVSYVSAVTDDPTVDCPDVWRVSPGNLETLVKYKAQFASTLGPDFVRELDKDISNMKEALKRGQSLSGPATCKTGAKVARSTERPPWPAPFKLVLLTDSACFSSCLLVTGELRRLGAVHVGQATDAATRYMEVREVELPSGLGFFSTLQKAALNTPMRLGPFEPEYLYDGDVADTGAVKKWVKATLEH